MPGVLKIAYKLLVNDRSKFAALLVGITFAVSAAGLVLALGSAFLFSRQPKAPPAR